MYIGDGGEGGGSEPVSMDDFSFGIEGLKVGRSLIKRHYNFMHLSSLQLKLLNKILPWEMYRLNTVLDCSQMHGAASRRNEVYIEERDVIVSELSTVRLRWINKSDEKQNRTAEQARDHTAIPV